MRNARQPGIPLRFMVSSVVIAAVAVVAPAVVPSQPSIEARLADDAAGADWAAFGRTYGEQHYSPLREIDGDTVGRLGLAWSLDLPPGNSVTGPLAVDGVLYFAAGYSVVRAVDAASGRLLWTFDPHAPEAAGTRLRQGWGSRGIAWWNGRIYTGTQDGRLIAIDARTGRQLWSAMTLEAGDDRFISGPPRVFAGKVVIGHGGADSGATRGYVTAYDAASGRKLWRFWTVPGNPANGFENAAMAMAARTWAGRWWTHGGGGTVWNAITYDQATDTLFIGTGNGAPWNRKIRSADKGDNLFLSSIVALDGGTGRYKWHYQVNPGETWDYNAAMDMQLADLMIGGRLRKVLLQAPKNGFFYVLDRISGKLISAAKITRVSWASRIDMATGRPVETPGARFPGGHPFELWPGNMGAHSWMPSAFSPRTGLVYIPVRDTASSIGDAGITPANWRFRPGNQPNIAVNLGVRPIADAASDNRSRLLAWDPVAQRAAWSLPTPGAWNGGIMATGGGLVFQGHVDGSFNAYRDTDGTRVWTFAAGAPILAPPISYRANGRQYVTVLTGAGTAATLNQREIPFAIDHRTQARRVLTFVLDGKAVLPKVDPSARTMPDDPGFAPNVASAGRGAALFVHCMVCHGVGAVAVGAAPDLRASAIPLDRDAFAQVVRGGALVPAGMPQFAEFRDGDLADLRQYIRTEAAAARTMPIRPAAR
ncbi:PQQ-dependent dehydrogenase, methanol/ethanol family [Sphingomonas profundi]|uniref:PQQ-dependent dehydrogenase, methanol/ethanol family n=1 Tax=Alterirhizorhabdus profundi TaxID=2681549 RepID=UPI001E2C0C98|nr:PQQ-dependent dehydrogenase, methanol/ethanol family [Sphingomonas profundi]